MKVILYIVIVFLFPAASFSQSSHEQTKIVVDYIFTLPSPDLRQTAKTQVSTQLLVGNTSSLFRGVPMALNKQYKLEQGSSRTDMKSKSNTPTIQPYIRNYDVKKKDLVGGVIIKPYYWEQDKSNLKWDIMKEKQVIAGYNCTKAKMFSERLQKYFFAWFTPELPFPTGPANSGGLPGLILKFESEDKSMSWEASKISKPDEMTKTVWFDNHAQKTTKADFDKAAEAYRKDPQLLLNQMNLKGSVSGLKVQ